MRIDKKDEIRRSPRSKAETLQMAKEALRANKKEWFLDGVLVPHLRDLQIQKVNPLSPRDFRVYSFHPEDIWKIAYGVITEEDLEEAAKNLPDIGLSTAEREVQIKKLDAEIEALEAQIEKELKKL